jgi:type IV secretory pathway VirB4 component
MANNASASQKFVPISEIRDGTVILKDGTLRGILMTSSLNFALKSEENQKSLIYQFQTYLNSLDFSTQIYVQSRKLDIRPYISLLEDRYKEQSGELFKIQTAEYIEFIKTFTENTSIMTKSFFVVVPYTPAIVNSGKKKGFIGGLFSKKDPGTAAQDKADQFEEQRSQLLQRMSVVEQGLTRTGIRIIVLGTEEIVELYYRIFNPGATEKPLKQS